MPQPTPNREKLALSRRQFLQGLGLALASGILAACGAAEAQNRWVTATPHQVLESPRPPGSTGTPVPDNPTLNAFLRLSSVLTGIKHLNPILGQVYLQHLQDTGAAIESLLEQALVTDPNQPPPAGIADLEAAGIFSQEQTSKLADQIIEMWYSGQISAGDQTTVVTFVDALAWKALTFTKPPTICGEYGFWALKPE